MTNPPYTRFDNSSAAAWRTARVKPVGYFWFKEDNILIQYSFVAFFRQFWCP